MGDVVAETCCCFVCCPRRAHPRSRGLRGAPALQATSAYAHQIGCAQSARHLCTVWWCISQSCYCSHACLLPTLACPQAVLRQQEGGRGDICRCPRPPPASQGDSEYAEANPAHLCFGIVHRLRLKVGLWQQLAVATRRPSSVLALPSVCCHVLVKCPAPSAAPAACLESAAQKCGEAFAAKQALVQMH